MTLVQVVKYSLSVLTVIGIGLLLFYVLSRPFRNTGPIQKLQHFVSKHAFLFAFIVALISLLGSMFFSEIAGYEPCKLCWFQRIAMYPLVIIFGVGLIKKLNPKPFALPLSIIGAPISAYHYGLQVYAKLTPGFVDACSATSVSCAAAPSFTFGFVTIPLMALIAFLLIILFTTRK